jgi:hypothetical protein
MQVIYLDIMLSPLRHSRPTPCPNEKHILFRGESHQPEEISGAVEMAIVTDSRVEGKLDAIFWYYSHTLLLETTFLAILVPPISRISA